MVESTIVDVEYQVKLPPVNLLNFNRLRFWMPDITMCFGENCPYKKDCYRYMAIPNEFRQSYFSSSPYNLGECKYWMYILKSDKIKKEYDEDRTGHRDGSIPQEDSSSSN